MEIIELIWAKELIIAGPIFLYTSEYKHPFSINVLAGRNSLLLCFLWKAEVIFEIAEELNKL